MKVTAVDTCVLTVPTPKPMALQYPQHKLVVAQIATDEGIHGLGYSLVFEVTPEMLDQFRVFLSDRQIRPGLGE